MTKPPVFPLCGAFLLLNFLTLLPLGHLPSIALLWCLTGLPPALHLCLWSRSAAGRCRPGQKRLTLSGWLLGIIWAANLYCIILQQIQPDAFIGIAIAVLGGSMGLLHILTTAGLMLTASSCTDETR